MSHPFLAQDLLCKWSALTADHIVPDITHALDQAKANIQAIIDQPLDSLSYESTFAALEDATDDLSRGWGRLNHLDSVSDNPEQREGLGKMLPAVSEFYSGIALNADLWNVLRTFAESDAVANLTPIQQRFVSETCADFLEAGANLEDQDKKRIAEIAAELAELTKSYGENVLDSTNAWELYITDQARLSGLPESALAAAKADAEAHHKPEAWRFTLQMPSLLPVLQFSDDRELRRELSEASAAIASEGEHDNTDLIWKILKLRDEKAQILGHENFADLTLSRRMAGTGAKAQHFGSDLHQRIKSAFQKDYEELFDYTSSKTDLTRDTIEPWDLSYWSEKLRQERYDFDEEALRPYFSVDAVMSGMFDIAQKLFGITIEQIEVSDDQLWHPEVKVYTIYDSDSKEHLGSFYADWHPRESKRGGAWMNHLETGSPEPRTPHIGLIVGNMSPPVGDTPALLTHREVETIFHEFGHLIHHLLSDVSIKSLAGTNVPWDFVELPSQLMENFCWDRESLDLFAKHYETGSPIPEDLFSKMVAARNFQSALGFMRQLSLAKLDLDLHIDYANSGKNLDEVSRDITEDYRIPLQRETPSIARRFSHLFSSPVGYACGYYSYKWAEVLDADAFTRFQKEGVLNPETGRAYRRSILAKGNSQPVLETYREFMGQDPELQPLLVRSGLA